MRIFALADAHLSLGADKPMDIFGAAWENHAERLRAAWSETVGEEDLVLVPGDISWAMTLENAKPDLAFLGALPGKKLLLRGNHDYWWSSATKVRTFLPEGMRIIQNDALVYGDFVIGGSRGWTFPGGEPLPGAEESRDRHIYTRELMRMEMSLAAMPAGRRRVFMTHFPPCDRAHPDTEVTALMERYGVETVVYGHLHGPSHRMAFIGEHNGVRYAFAAADYLDFRPLCIAETEDARGNTETERALETATD